MIAVRMYQMMTDSLHGETSTFSQNQLFIAEGGFDPPTSGLWAQHASSAPLC